MGANRRAVLAGLAGLPFAVVPAVATPSRVLAGSAEPIVILRRRFLAHMAVVDHYMAATTVTKAQEDEADAAMNAARDLEDEAERETVETTAGALAALEWGRDEFAGCYVQGRDRPEIADVWTLAMLDKALGVLRQATMGGAS